MVRSGGIVIIAGAGLAGLIAGCMFPRAQIAEAAPAPTAAHRALLRFRSDAVSQVTGIPFQQVSVQKAVFWRGSYVAPDLRLANLYSHKVTGRLMNRSILDTAPVTRWVAPETLHEQLVERCHGRLNYGCPVQGIRQGTIPLLSTVPMPTAIELWLDGEPSALQFDRAPIMVHRFRIANAELNQTVYLPDPETSTYRVSVTGSLLIAESMLGTAASPMIDPQSFAKMLGAGSATDIVPIDTVEQRFGKIVPIDAKVRRAVIHRLTTQAGVYSVGRFATWRNILLDDVVNDLQVIRLMIQQDDAYALHMKAGAKA